MSDARQPVSDKIQRSNRRLAFVCAGFFAGMVGMAYAAVPLYDMFCRVTGYGGTTQRTDQYSDVILDKEIKVRFDANVSGGLGWEFTPKQREVKLKIGETVQVAYVATNITSKPLAGRATFNVSPPLAGAYFMKVECFCFTDTTLQPGETMEMPVVFYVDPEIVNVKELKNLTTLTLSYTFFPMNGEKSEVSSAASIKSKTDADTSFGG
jgi:cytochrome c oxidase assembly protein subunit 11